MLTLTIPQSEPSAARNRSASRWSGVKMLEERPCGTSLCSAMASSSVRVGEHVEDRRERLVLDDVGLPGHPHEGRLDVVRVRAARPAAAPAADEHLAALGAGLLERRCHGGVRGLRRSAARRACPSASGSPIGRPRVDARASRSTRASATSSCTISRRIVVQRWPAVPAAAKTIPRAARSRSADGATTAALLPPSSSRLRPKRAATRGATAAPIRVEPVALTSATSGLSTSASPTSAAADDQDVAGPPGAPQSAAARSSSAEQAAAVSGVIGDGFQTTVSPQTRAIAVFQDHTAAGKLNAEITPTTPSGCQVSISRWPGRSEGIVRPSSWRDRPTAKSQMSIISCTSPSASERILPASIVIELGQVLLVLGEQLAEALDERAAQPARGRCARSRNAACAAAIAASTSAAPAAGTAKRSSPVIGVRAAIVGPLDLGGAVDAAGAPARRARASRSSSVAG